MVGLYAAICTSSPHHRKERHCLIGTPILYDAVNPVVRPDISAFASGAEVNLFLTAEPADNFNFVFLTAARNHILCAVHLPEVPRNDVSDHLHPPQVGKFAKAFPVN